MFGVVLLFAVDLALPRPIYVVVVFVYVIVSFLLLWYWKTRRYSHILDLCLILLFLFGVDVGNCFCFAFLLFPLISRGVYIDRYTYDKFFIPEYIILVVVVDASFGLQNILFYVFQALVVVMFALLYWMSVQRMKDDKRMAQMLDKADDYFLAQIKSYEVYKKIIERLSIEGVEVKSITCFECDSQIQKFHLVNSSYLVSTFFLNLNTIEKIHLQNGDSISDVDYMLDNVKQKRNEVYSVVQPSTIFLFVVVYQPDAAILNNPDFEPLFLRMSRIITFERVMREKRDSTIQDMIKKSRFVNGATNVMHFIKNRLTPLQTLVDLAKNEGDVKKLDNFDEILEKTAFSAQREINAILDKAEYLLNKQNNPFVFIKEGYDAHTIFEVLSSIWSNLLPLSDKIVVDTKQEVKTLYESNIEGLEILFSDIIGNMNKYAKNYLSCVFKQNDNSILTISFENDFGNSKDIEALINDVNNPNKDAVIYRTSYGVANIRAISDNLCVGLLASLVEKDNRELYRLELNFKPKKDEENTNH